MSFEPTATAASSEAATGPVRSRHRCYAGERLTPQMAGPIEVERPMAAPAKVSTIQTLWPLLAVDDLGASLRFWRDRLGFKLAGQAESDGQMFWCRLERDGASIMLQAADVEDGPAKDRGRGVTLYFVCDDVDALFEEVRSRGLRVDPPTVAYYGMRQLYVPEPNGYFVCFETPVEE
jgi:glyoxylase I family protein